MSVHCFMVQMGSRFMKQPLSALSFCLSSQYYEKMYINDKNKT